MKHKAGKFVVKQAVKFGVKQGVKRAVSVTGAPLGPVGVFCVGFVVGKVTDRVVDAVWP